jgi:hypothetical protein
MADDNVTIWGSGLKFGRKPANGELLIGDGELFRHIGLYLRGNDNHAGVLVRWRP